MPASNPRLQHRGTAAIHLRPEAIAGLQRCSHNSSANSTFNRGLSPEASSTGELVCSFLVLNFLKLQSPGEITAELSSDLVMLLDRKK